MLDENTLKMDIYRIIRVHAHKKAKTVMKHITKAFPDEDPERIKKITSELMRDLMDRD